MTGDHHAAIMLAERTALLPRLASRVARDEPQSSVMASLDGVIATAAANAAILEQTAADVARALGEAGVPCVFMKGVAFIAHGLNAEPGDRHTDDVDVLVPEAALADAALALQRCGFVPSDRMRRVTYDGGTRAELRPPGEHAWGALESPLGVEVDLHFAVPDGRLCDFSALAPHCVEREVRGVPISVPDLPALLAQMCEHVVLHHACIPRYLPRHAADLVDIVDAAGSDVWDAARAVGVPLAIEVSRLLLETAAGERMGSALFPDVQTSRLIEAVIEGGRTARRVGRDVRTNPARLARKVLPARRFISATYGVSETDPRLPFYYVHRLVSLRWLRDPYRG
jgi:hypothetical protein